MELEKNNNDTSQWKRLFKERGLNVGKRATKVHYHVALGALEVVMRMLATTEEQEEDTLEDEAVELKGEDEEENGLATGPEQQHPEAEEDNTLTVVKSPATTGSSVSSLSLSCEGQEDDWMIKLQMDKLKLEASKEEAAEKSAFEKAALHCLVEKGGSTLLRT
ncbi:hypothetical protein NDU88_005599 [Pleurodeles waltl]|uniref:Uncharacterized protein n=1 Tax=Pleurodeles waltl TaxID=8319 RepID=A0AAV7PIK9_PLEWA|nr:hypothetical protein NDU88_005599 [Pleurodeles waltl]